ncbi:hypothetical protein BDDG_12077 [Blastomyces dermatitidis ATCC 18188]|uniref:Uncharacterized protein n=1 Tax=Ajellomyces dermatitidis (strain ATCC 18188 / CBS 674.68) TaxID=653446 RepID=A0A0J9EMP8_AJEDA|nr:hypothetical protein BDDG_12077 [Blastomyces dermatitidis ATCC 18188]
MEYIIGCNPESQRDRISRDPASNSGWGSDTLMAPAACESTPRREMKKMMKKMMMMMVMMMNDE